MEQVSFENVLIVDAGSPYHGQQVDVHVEAGRIHKIVGNSSGQPMNGCLAPGFVDMRCHLSDPGFEAREDLASLSAAALQGGFTRLVTLPSTSPVIDNAGQVRSLVHRSAGLPIHLHPSGALSLGLQGRDMAELYEMWTCGAVAFTDGRKGTQSGHMLLMALQYVQPFGGLILQSPVDQGLARDEQVGEGITSVRMGMKGLPVLAELAMVERDLRLLEEYGGRLHIGPVTTAAALGLIRKAKSAGLKFTVETSALYLLLDSTANEAYDPVTKVYPPLRDKASVEALREAVLDGTVDVVSSSHHPQGLEEKTHDFYDAAFGADSLETAFAAANTALGGTKAALDRLVESLSIRPREILGLPAATLVEGNTAELTHFDPQGAWTPDLSHIRSKSKSNPLLGMSLQGRVLGTYVKGRAHRTEL